MKRNYIFKSTVAFLFLVLSSAVINSQVRGFDEFMMNPDDFGPVGNSSNNTGPEIADFSFASSTTFDVALANQVLWNLARQQLRTAWFSKQKNLIKEHIEDKFNENYPTYEAAQEKLFLDSEIKNVLRNVVEPRTRYQSLRSQAFGAQRENLKDLKLLVLREIELQAGNINNPEYGYMQVANTYIKDITNINQIEQFRGPIIPLFEENTANAHQYNYIYQKLNNLGDGIHQEALDLKKGYYNGFEDWTKLNYMQFLIQYEEIKRLTSVPYYYPNLINLMNQFRDTDQATSQMIETYARSNRDGGNSIFSYAYFQELLNQAMISGGNQYVDYSDMYASVQEEWELEKLQVLNNLLNNFDLSNFKKWFLDVDNDGYHAPGSSPRQQSSSPGAGWREGISNGVDCDDNDELLKKNCDFKILSVQSSIYNGDKHVFDSSGNLALSIKFELSGETDTSILNTLLPHLSVTIDNIDGTLTPSNITNNGTYFEVTLTKTGMPAKNSDFGQKYIKLNYKSIQKDDKLIKVFFNKNDTTNTSGDPNWFFYWKEGNVCGIPNTAIYDSSASFGYVLPGTDNILRLGPDAPTTNTGPETYNLAANSVTGQVRIESHTVTGTGKGIYCVAETVAHELYHLTLYGLLSSRVDTDGDGIADADEASLDGIFSWIEMGDSYPVYVGAGYSDNEIRCRKKELSHSVSVNSALDWSKDGENW